MLSVSGCLIEAGLWLIAPGDWRYDAAIRVDGGRVAQIGTWEAVAYGVDHLPRYGARDAFAVPLGDALTPGARADLALFRPGVAPSLAALRSGSEGLYGLFLAGRALDQGADAALAQARESLFAEALRIFERTVRQGRNLTFPLGDNAG